MELQYINKFISNIRHDDPLPVRPPGHKITENEIDGQIIDTVFHYLSYRECPPYIRLKVANQVWNDYRKDLSRGVNTDSVDHGNMTYEPLKLITDVVNRVNCIMTDLQKSLSSAVQELPHYLPVSHYAIKNCRKKMEDRHVVIQDLNTLYNLKLGEPHAYYAVFDGHVCANAAVYSATMLHQFLIQHPMYEFDPVTALKHAFSITDTNFIKRTEKEKLKGGTTAVVALVREKRLVVAWLGDSLALLVRKRRAVHVGEPHKPSVPSEKKRIEDAGGAVVNIQGTWRVLGQLAVSRAIGDVALKPYGVTSECDIKTLEIAGDEDFLILACDGLWDHLNPEDAVNIVYKYLIKNEGDTDGVARCLVEAARNYGSVDNITSVVVFLRPIDLLMEEENIRIEQGLVGDMDSFVVPQKGGLPPSIHAIFAPRQMEVQNAVASFPDMHNDQPQTNGHNNHSPVHYYDDRIVPEIPPRDYDSDEGMGDEIIERNGHAPSQNSHNPTEEEVDAVLAELDSIPEAEGDENADGVEDDEWSYHQNNLKNSDHNEPSDEIEISSPRNFNEAYNISPSTSPKIPPSIAPRTFPPSCPKSSPSTSPKISPSTSPRIFSSTSPKISPSISPRTVEGFVTSVELNSAQEAFTTNLVVNQTDDYFGVSTVPIETNSGPFSVYVSSSPEPSGSETMESAPIIENLELTPDQQAEHVDNKMHVELGSPTTTSVEIVHAQSTVEVMSSNEDLMGQYTPCVQSSVVPDIMNHSYTYDLLSSNMPLPKSEDFLPVHVNPLELEPVGFSFSGAEAGGSPDIIPDRSHYDRKFDQEVDSHSEKDLNTKEFDQSPVLEEYPLDPTEFENGFLPRKSFEVTLDPMAASFHEDQIPASDLVSSLKESSGFNLEFEQEASQSTAIELELSEAQLAARLSGLTLDSFRPQTDLILPTSHLENKEISEEDEKVLGLVLDVSQPQFETSIDEALQYPDDMLQNPEPGADSPVVPLQYHDGINEAVTEPMVSPTLPVNEVLESEVAPIPEIVPDVVSSNFNILAPQIELSVNEQIETPAASQEAKTTSVEERKKVITQIEVPQFAPIPPVETEIVAPEIKTDLATSEFETYLPTPEIKTGIISHQVETEIAPQIESEITATETEIVPPNASDTELSIKADTRKKEISAAVAPIKPATKAADGKSKTTAKVFTNKIQTSKGAVDAKANVKAKPLTTATKTTGAITKSTATSKVNSRPAAVTQKTLKKPESSTKPSTVKAASNTLSKKTTATTTARTLNTRPVTSAASRLTRPSTAQHSTVTTRPTVTRPNTAKTTTTTSTVGARPKMTSGTATASAVDKKLPATKKYVPPARPLGTRPTSGTTKPMTNGVAPATARSNLLNKATAKTSASSVTASKPKTAATTNAAAKNTLSARFANVTAKVSTNRTSPQAPSSKFSTGTTKSRVESSQLTKDVKKTTSPTKPTSPTKHTTSTKPTTRLANK